MEHSASGEQAPALHMQHDKLGFSWTTCCANCGTAPAVVDCANCRSVFCEKCDAEVHAFRLTQDHRRVAIFTPKQDGGQNGRKRGKIVSQLNDLEAKLHRLLRQSEGNTQRDAAMVANVLHSRNLLEDGAFADVNLHDMAKEANKECFPLASGFLDALHKTELDLRKRGTSTAVNALWLTQDDEVGKADVPAFRTPHTIFGRELRPLRCPDEMKRQSVDKASLPSPSKGASCAREVQRLRRENVQRCRCTLM